MRQIRILLAEDDCAHQRLLLRAIVRGDEAGEVTTTSTRDELIAAARGARYDCIVLDYNVPPHTAPELIADLLPLQPGVPCVVVSASEEQRVVIDSLRTGVADFIPKHEAYHGGALRVRIEAAMTLAKAQRVERRHINRRLRRLEKQANTDALTGLHNRRAADAVLEDMGLRQDRRTATSLVLIDLDHFKSINDTLGHDAGDHVLRDVAKAITNHCAETDFAARWGGEEFLVIRQSGSLADAWIWADELRRAITSHVALPDGCAPQTASIGVDVMPTCQVSTHAVIRADRAMYAAKDGGRDRVCTWQMAEALDAAHDLQSDPALSPRERLLELVELFRCSMGPTQFEHVGSHGARVRELCELAIRPTPDNVHDCTTLALAAEFHDIGKIGVPVAVLALPRRLTAGERRFVNEHSRFGAEILLACGAAAQAADAVRRHHDRFDVPDSSEHAASHDSMPSMAAVICACDAFVAMTSERAYSGARSVPDSLAELGALRSLQIHPAAVDAVARIDRARLAA